MTAADTLERGRDALQRHAWADAYALMSAAQRDVPLEPEDLERLALAAYLVGNDDCAAAWLGAHQGFARRGEMRRAARCAFWQACGLLFRGELAPALGWIARGRRVLEAAPQDCVERGWLLLLTALPVMFEGDADSAYGAFVQADEIAKRCGDLDLAMFARLGRGWSLILQQHVTEGMALLDEVMVAVVAGELSPILTGIFYCSTIEVCQSVLDLRRAGVDRRAVAVVRCPAGPGPLPRQLLGPPLRDLPAPGRMARRAGRRPASVRPPISPARLGLAGMGLLPVGGDPPAAGRGCPGGDSLPPGQPRWARSGAGQVAAPPGAGRGRRRSGQHPARAGRDAGPGCPGEGVARLHRHHARGKRCWRRPGGCR